MKKLYRVDYEGEFLVDGFNLENGRRTENRVFIPNTLVNNAHTKHAVIIGNGRSRLKVPLNKIENHAGGHLGKRRLQSYGCNALYRDMKPDFLVCLNPFLVKDIVNSKYADEHIVMTNATNIKNYPGSLHLFPYGMQQNAGSLATWLACFDGHKKVYLLGFDNQDGVSNNNVYAGTQYYATEDTPAKSGKWEAQMKRIFDAYDDVDFAWVAGGISRFPEEWKYCLNLRQLDVRQFIVEVDL